MSSAEYAGAEKGHQRGTAKDSEECEVLVCLRGSQRYMV